ncbi:hypothetical protein [Oceanobacillus picturae]|uniref:hypothetical protein n=1 Tax=Oceanobacillus picturae TaxID=171693 RepID=UPI0021756CD0|nr:hypothetical protein [Oceanobacillus picturae]
MIKSVVKEFLNSHDKILNGEFDEEIIELSDASRVRKVFKELAHIIFESKEILKREYAGGRAIDGLLSMFVDAVTSENYKDSRTAEGKLFLLISDNYRDIMNKFPYESEDGEPSVYDKLLLVTDFICGMTDTYALELYKNLSGINL